LVTLNRVRPGRFHRFNQEFKSLGAHGRDRYRDRFLLLLDCVWRFIARSSGPPPQLWQATLFGRRC
jgi:hypothetical protein